MTRQCETCKTPTNDGRIHGLCVDLVNNTYYSIVNGNVPLTDEIKSKLACCYRMDIAKEFERSCGIGIERRTI